MDRRKPLAIIFWSFSCEKATLSSKTSPVISGLRRQSPKNLGDYAFHCYRRTWPFTVNLPNDTLAEIDAFGLDSRLGKPVPSDNCKEFGEIGNGQLQMFADGKSQIPHRIKHFDQRQRTVLATALSLAQWLQIRPTNKLRAWRDVMSGRSQLKSTGDVGEKANLHFSH